MECSSLCTTANGRRPRFYTPDFTKLSKAALNSDNSTVKSNTVAVFVYVLKAILILLAPFISFVTEHIYLSLNLGQESINLEPWSSLVDFETTPKATVDMNLIIAVMKLFGKSKPNIVSDPKNPFV